MGCPATAAEAFGRQEEVARALDAVRAGGSVVRAVVLTGPPGVGKSAVWREVCRELELDGRRMFVCRAAEAEARLSYCGMADLVSEVFDEYQASLAAPLRRGLEVALLRWGPPDGAIETRAIAAGTLGLLGCASERDPIVIAVDDVQWLYPASVEAFAFALRRLRIGTAAVVLAARDGAPAPLIDGLEAEGVLARVPIGPLAYPAMRQMLSADAATRVSPRETRWIHAESGGNPLLAKELARARSRPAGDQEPTADTSTRLGRLLRSRIADLSPASRKLVLAVATAASPSRELMRAVMDAADPADGIEEATRLGLLAEDERGEIFFGHPLMASAVIAVATPAERRAMHARLASVAGSIEQRARHLALSREEPDEDVAAQVEAAARDAATRGALVAAAELAELTLASTPPASTDDRWRRLVLLGERLFEVGETTKAEAAARAVTDAAPRGSLRACALHLLGRIAFWTDRVYDSTDLLVRALDEASPDRRLQAEIEIELSWSNVLPSDARLTHARAAVALLSGREEQGALPRALIAEVNARRELGEPPDFRRLERAERLQAKGPPPRVDELVEFERAGCLVALDRFDEARAHLQRLLRIAEGRGEDGILPELHAHLVRIEWFAGRWPVAAEHARAATVAALEAGHPPVLGCLTLVYPLAPTDPASPELAEVLPTVERAAAGGDNSQAVIACVGLGLLALAREDWHRAVEWFDRTAELVDRYRSGSTAARFEGLHVDALLAAGEVDRARTRLARLERQVSHGRSRWAGAVLARCRGMILTAYGSLDAARAELRDATALARDLGMPFELARTLLAHGEVERRAKQKRSARHALTEARDGFAQLGAVPWVARAEAALSRVGGRSSDGISLTGGERRVVVLAARGHTNSEIAAELFISVHTVESNLTRAYRKLGIRSRSQLAARLAADQT